jgi:hypothetical protein
MAAGSIDPVQQLPFEYRALGGILLDEFRFGHRILGLRMKAEAVFRDRLGAAEADERRPGSGNKPAQEVLSRRRWIAGRNRKAPRQEKSCPARTDRTGSDHRNMANFAARHACFSF